VRAVGSGTGGEHGQKVLGWAWVLEAYWKKTEKQWKGAKDTVPACLILALLIAVYL